MIQPRFLLAEQPGDVEYYDYSKIDPICIPVDPLNRTRPNDRPFVRDFSLFLVITTIVYVAVALARFRFYQRKYVHVQKRSFLMVLTSGLGALCQVFGNSLWIALDYVCWVKVFLFLFVVPFLTMSIPIRMLDYYTKHIFARKLLIALRAKEQQANEAYANEQREDNNKISDAENDPSLIVVGSNAAPKVVGGIDMRQLRKLKFLTSIWAKLILIVLMLLPNLLVFSIEASMTPHLNPYLGCRGCFTPSITILVLLLDGALMTIIGVGIYFLVRKYPDPFGIVTELLLASVFGGAVAVTGFILDLMVESPPNFTFGWVIWLGCMNILFITSDYQILIAMRTETPKSEVHGSEHATTRHNASQVHHEHTDSVAGPPEGVVVPYSAAATGLAEGEKLNTTKLRKLLQNNIVVDFFEEHLVSEFSVELIRMYLECQTFKRIFHDITEKTRRARSKRIVETYVVNTAMSQVNLSDTLQRQIVSTVMDSSKDITMDLFKESDMEILKMMLGSYQRFTKTPGYEQMQLRLGQEQPHSASPNSSSLRVQSRQASKNPDP